MNNKLKQALYHHTPLKILSFLSVHPTEILSAKDIARKTDSSKGATHQALKILMAMDILTRTKKSNLFLYSLNAHNIFLKQFKIFENVLSLHKLIKAIQPFCSEVILFGSCATGINTTDSDIDLFVKTEHKKTVHKQINKYKRHTPQLNVAVYDPLEILKSQKADKAFFEQVKKGIILWEGKPTYEKF